MPLMPGNTRAAISANIREMMAAGHPRQQAIAAALHTARRAAGGGLTGHGSPVNLSALPTFAPSQVGDTGMLPSGFMRTPAVGDFTLDPATGALTPAAQAALRALAQRGLTINGGAPAGAGGAGGAGGTGGGGSGSGGIGTEGGAVGSVGAPAGADWNGFHGFNGVDLGFSGSGALKGGMSGLSAFGPLGAVVGAGLGGLLGGSSLNDGMTSGSSLDALNHEAESNVESGAGPLARGGRASGGAASSPFYTRSEARGMEHPAGLVMSPIGGRSDHIPMNLASGSYVIPADVVSGSGQGNTMAGGHAFDEMVRSGPHGTRLPMPKIRGTLPKPPGMPRVVGAHHFARGGRMRGRVPVIVAGGERIVSPDEVAQLSGGDMKKGHSMLDRWVVEMRKHIIAHTRKLPGPVGAKS